jgi:hypothetical protein
MMKCLLYFVDISIDLTNAIITFICLSIGTNIFSILTILINMKHVEILFLIR